MQLLKQLSANAAEKERYLRDTWRAQRESLDAGFGFVPPWLVQLEDQRSLVRLSFSLSLH